MSGEIVCICSSRGARVCVDLHREPRVGPKPDQETGVNVKGNDV